MPSKPNNLPRWADNGGSIVEPNAGKKDVGFVVGEKPPAQYVNWLSNLAYQWFQYLDDLTNQALTWTAAHIFQKGITVTQSNAGQSASNFTDNAAGAGVVANGGASGKGIVATGYGASKGADVYNGASITGGTGVTALEVTATSGGAGAVILGSNAGTGATIKGGSSGIGIEIAPTVYTNDGGLLVARDASNGVRSIVDHNGYRMGPVREVQIDWGYENLVAGARSTYQPFWSLALVGTGSVTNYAVHPTAGSAWPTLQVQCNGGSNGDRAHYCSDYVIAATSTRSVVVEFMIALGATVSGNSKLVWGLSAGGSPENATDAVWASWTPGDTQLRFNAKATGTAALLAQATVATTPTTPTGGVPNWHRVRIEMHGSSTPYGAVTRMFLNGTQYVNYAAVPTTGLVFAVGAQVNAAGQGVQQALIGPVRIAQQTVITTVAS